MFWHIRGIDVLALGKSGFCKINQQTKWSLGSFGDQVIKLTKKNSLLIE
jgi:hypothetical protein